LPKHQSTNRFKFIFQKNHFYLFFIQKSKDKNKQTQRNTKSKNLFLYKKIFIPLKNVNKTNSM